MTPKLEDLLGHIEQLKDRLLAVVVHLNDTYTIGENADLQQPGFPRVVATVRAVRAHTTRICGEDRTLVVHSGDFLGPSRIGRLTKGAAITELLSHLGVDWCVLGNHELDYGESVLLQRLQGASFKVALANVETTQPAFVPLVLWPSPERPLVALTGVVSQTVHRSFPEGWKFIEPTVRLREFVTATVDVPFRVVLTHATRDEDREIRKNLPPRTVLLGGHDHDIDWVEDDGPLIMKNRSNLATVRFVLLLAGGTSPLNDLVTAHDALHRRRGPGPSQRVVLDEIDTTIPTFPEDCEEILGDLHPLDAAVLRRALAGVDANSLVGPGTLLNALVRLRPGPDFPWTLFAYDDHEPAEEDAQAIVDRASSSTSGGEEIVRDFSSECPAGFDVRDDAVRWGPTAFGMWVAECVRRAMDADFAILNAGSFRADGAVPAKARLRDLLDCFLYDHDEAVVLLEMPRATAEALISYGRRMGGTGAYPQIALSVPTNDAKVRVAIASYLLGAANSIDGYDDVFAAECAVRREAVPQLVASQAIARASIVAAVRAQAAAVELPAVPESELAQNPADQFIFLVRPVFELLASSGTPTTEVRHVLGGDGELSDAELQRRRDAVRTWVRALPKVAALQQATSAGDTSDLRALVPAAHEELRTIIRALARHRACFRDRINYPTALENAARGIAGWYP